jgi:SAM-dependent methyltransferase
MNTLWRRTARKWGLAAHAYSRGPHKRQWYRLLTRPDLTFMQLAAQAKAEAWGNWQTYRFSMPTFLAAHALAHLAQGCRAILDFGCGIGHSAFLMRRVAPQALMVCADRSFTSLYLAQRFMVPDALAVCLDGNYSLPFDRDQFDLVFSTDALQYIDAKRNLAREFQRVLDPDGTIALAHLHNRLSAPGGCTGKGLTARGYQGLFDGMERRVYAEEQLVDDYVVDGALRLDRTTEAGELDAKQCSVSLVAANTQSVFRAHAGISDAHIDAMRHPLLNPVYRASGAGTSWTLDRTVAAPYAIERTFREYDILPQRCSVSTGSLDRAGLLAMREADPAQMRDLARRFVILDMPEFYA